MNDPVRYTQSQSSNRKGQSQGNYKPSEKPKHKSKDKHIKCDKSKKNKCHKTTTTEEDDVSATVDGIEANILGRYGPGGEYHQCG